MIAGAWPLALLVLVPTAGGAADPARPNFEVKLLLDPARALTRQGDLTPEVKAEFGVQSPPRRQSVAFLDDAGLSLNGAGWTVRLRRRDGDEECELTFKRRYAVEDGLDAALQVPPAERTT